MRALLPVHLMASREPRSLGPTIVNVRCSLLAIVLLISVSNVSVVAAGLAHPAPDGVAALRQYQAANAQVASPQWYQNFQETQLWSGPDSSAISFGAAPQWDYFQILEQGFGHRVRVLVVRTRGEAFVAAAVLGPSGPPPAGWPNTEPAVGQDPAGPGPASLTRVQPTMVTLPGYSIQAQVGFEPALLALLEIKHFWTLNALASTGTRLEWANLRPDAAGMYAPGDALVSINRRWMRSDQRAVAALVEHEAKHVADWLAGEDMSSPRGCLATEARAFREEAKTWGELVGPNGKPDPRDELERSLNWKLSIYQRDPAQIDAIIVQNDGYRVQCRF